MVNQRTRRRFRVQNLRGNDNNAAKILHTLPGYTQVNVTASMDVEFDVAD